MKKNILNSPRLLEIKKKRRKILKRKTIYFLITVFGLFILLSFVSRHKEINISHFDIKGNNIVDTEEIEKIVQEELAGKYLFIVPKTNFLLYPKKRIEERLGTTHKRLKDIKLDIVGTKNLSIQVGERTGVFTWCGEDLPLLGTKLEELKCYFLDEGGYVFDVAPYFSGDVYFKFFGPLSGDSGERAGNTYLPTIFKDVVIFKESLEYMGISPIAFAVKDKEARIYLESYKELADSPKIILNVESDYNALAENLDSAITTAPLKEDFKKKYETLEYIDLRFDNRVYYKFK